VSKVTGATKVTYRNTLSARVVLFSVVYKVLTLPKKLSELYHPYSMGETAENVAKQWNISRHAQDEFAFESQQKYANAFQAGRFKDEIIPFQVSVGKENFEFLQNDGFHVLGYCML
jgi:acetyl-CoA acetyltransferase